MPEKRSYFSDVKIQGQIIDDDSKHGVDSIKVIKLVNAHVVLNCIILIEF